MLHQFGVSFDLYYDARKHKIKNLQKHVVISYIATNFDIVVFTTVFIYRYIHAAALYYLYRSSFGLYFRTPCNVTNGLARNEIVFGVVHGRQCDTT